MPEVLLCSEHSLVWLTHQEYLLLLRGENNTSTRISGRTQMLGLMNEAVTSTR